MEETETSITGKLARGTFAASFFLACLAVLELGVLMHTGDRIVVRAAELKPPHPISDRDFDAIFATSGELQPSPSTCDVPIKFGEKIAASSSRFREIQVFQNFFRRALINILDARGGERTMRFNVRFGRLLSTTTLTSSIYLAASGIALAAGSSPANTPTCPPGEVYNSSTKKCEQRHSGTLPDKDLADYAYALAKGKRYDEALEVLNLMRNPNTAQALNYRGYATRHLGRLDEGIGYYLQSVKLDPHYAQVREYLGEAYVTKGDLVSAKYQLGKIKTICGNTRCEEYEDLEKAIAGHPEDEG